MIVSKNCTFYADLKIVNLSPLLPNASKKNYGEKTPEHRLF
jgi:hypothetical protein